MRHKMLFITALILCFGLFPSIALADQVVQLSNGSFKYSSSAGKTIQDQVTVDSAGSEQIPRVLVYVANVTYDAKGNPDYIVPSRTTKVDVNKSPASWIQLYLDDSTKTYQNTPYIELPIHGSSTVRFSVNIPSSAPPGDYSAVIFFEMDNTSAQSTGSSAVNARAGVRINIRVEGNILQKIKLTYDKISSVVFDNNLLTTLNFSNQGNIDTKVKTKLELKQGNKVIKDFNLKNFTEFTIPANTPKLLYSDGYAIDKFLMGKYDLVATYAYYDEQLQKDVDSELITSVWFIPWWVILISVLFPILLILVFSRRLFSRSNRKSKNNVVPMPEVSQIQTAETSAVNSVPNPNEYRDAVSDYERGRDRRRSDRRRHGR